LALAYEAARAGERVLLVDATSRNANLSTTFARAPDPGSVVILDRIEDLARLTTRPAALGFAILPLALLLLPELTPSQRARLANGLAALAKSFDRVFLDAGALLEDDAVSAFLPIADEILIVTRWGTTVKTDVHELEQLLERYADRPHGLVLNAVSESS
jgi:Mrp family chromosome partitioning ATPase